MKRLLLHSIVMLFAFVIGSALVALCAFYNAAVRQEQSAKWTETERVAPTLTFPQPPSAKPKGLSSELQRIDESYKKRCAMPDEDDYKWPAIVRWDKFLSCNDEWAKARREAILTERNYHLINY